MVKPRSLHHRTLKVSLSKEPEFVKPMPQGKITPATEDYLRTICALEDEVQPVIAARVADEMGVTPSTMVSTLRRLQREGYIKVERRKEIHLTGEGRKVAEGILRRHFLLERFL